MSKTQTRLSGGKKKYVRKVKKMVKGTISWGTAVFEERIVLVNSLELRREKLLKFFPRGIGALKGEKPICRQAMAAGSGGGTAECDGPNTNGPGNSTRGKPGRIASGKKKKKRALKISETSNDSPTKNSDHG